MPDGKRGTGPLPSPERSLFFSPAKLTIIIAGLHNGGHFLPA